ncbi:hypothetical protein B5M47_01130 [candidate division CPR3 bacterium 4484_211]|uniref:Response regulatory domain-containing protein n=1 Tax=candidate division CPR3 bacterium 4484_211 TaxID=1968527 RepID=A0A1W9NYS3_UNCC3|nr:MAG: hypothetical protein B5M47_01130 [candidate division CPR3 bacterium 4484_211]
MPIEDLQEQEKTKAPQDIPKAVLLIEDDIFVKDLYERTLTKRGYKVIVAEDGEEGVKKANENVEEIGLVLLDIMMPKLNGIEVLQKLMSNEKTKNLYVVLLTNLGQESIIKEAFNIGAKGYMLKARLLPAQIADNIDEFFRTGIFPLHEPNGL